MEDFILMLAKKLNVEIGQEFIVNNEDWRVYKIDLKKAYFLLLIFLIEKKVIFAERVFYLII